MPVQPLPPRYQIEELDDQLVVITPSLKIWPFILVVGLWSCMWSVIEIALIFSLFAPEISGRLYVLFYVVIWTPVGIFLLYSLFWQLIGRESIEVTARSITLGQVVLGYKRSKEYLAEHIRALGLARASVQDVMRRGWPIQSGSGSGSISFDYGARTYKFAASLDDAEAKQVVAAIQQKYPQYKQ